LLVGVLCEAFEQGTGASLFDGEVVGDFEGFEVGADGGERGLGLLGEPDVSCAAAEGLDADGTGAGVEIGEAAVGDAGREDVEEGLAQAVAGRARVGATRGDELARAMGSGDDAHGSIIAGGASNFGRAQNGRCRMRSMMATTNAYNGAMRGWSFPVGRYFGVEVRIHAFFLLLLAMAILGGSLVGWNNGRVLALWLMLLLAVVVRELARALAAAWYGLELRSILLLPTGGLMSYGTLDATERAADPAIERRMAMVGPIASIGFGMLLAAIVLASAPGINLIEKPWIAPSHLLRALVWLNLLLGLVNLLPALPLDGGRVFRSAEASGAAEGDGAPNGKDRRRALESSSGGKLGSALGFNLGGGLGQWIAIALVVAGILLTNLWLIVMGAFVLIGAQMESQGMLAQGEVDTVRMRDVMLTQFSTLSASDTLEDALQRAVHTLQDVFPVVRGGTLVGAVSRQNIVEALAASGNSYVQGVMTRSFQTALPDDSLVKTLRRIMGAEGAQLVPVMDGERILGIVTPQNLSQSMGLLNQSRRMRRSETE
jgi:Zn-dependent protease/CBS domain-containing protein